jgi:hypothetical protein
MAITSVDRQPRRTTRAPYRLSLETAGFLTLLLGAWVGVVAYVAPSFGLSADGTASWTWSLAHSLLFLAPGIGAFLAGLIIMAEAPSTGPSRGFLIGFGGLLAALCGAWLVVGPVAWQALEGTAFFIPATTATRELAYWIGYALGPGGLLLALGAFVLGRPHASLAVTATSATVSPPRAAEDLSSRLNSDEAREPTGDELPVGELRSRA